MQKMILSLLSLLLLSGAQLPLVAQEQIQKGTSRDEIVNGLIAADTLMHTQVDTATSILRQLMTTARADRQDSLLMETYFEMCLAMQEQTLFDSSLYYTRKAGELVFTHQYANHYAGYYKFMARFHRYLNHPDSAIYYLQLFDDVMEQKGTSGRWLSQQELSFFYSDFGEFKLANNYMEEALKYARIDKKPMDYLYVLYSAMDLYSRQDSMAKVSALSEEYLTYKLEHGTNILDPQVHMSLMLPNPGSGNQISLLEKYLPVHLANGDKLAAINAYHAIGTIYANEKEYARAVPPFEAALKIANSLTFPNLRYNLHASLFSVFDEMPDAPNALIHHKAMAAILDTIRNKEREATMHELQIKYETAEKEKELTATQYQLEDARRGQQLFGLAGIALFCITGLIFYAYRQKRKSVRDLAAKNEIISKALGEKDILLREIHHRVKNNLQMISALLYLHGKSVEDSSAQEALLESQNRVQSMAMIHQNLYQDANLLGVGVRDYLDKLLSHLIASYNVEKDRIRIKTKIEIDHLDVDTIVPLALIINELISNSLKYAFGDGRRGEIDVYMGREDNHILVEVSDNGKGLPKDFSITDSPNFGYKLINILAERLGATLTAVSDNGTQVSLSIPLKTAA